MQQQHAPEYAAEYERRIAALTPTYPAPPPAQPSGMPWSSQDMSQHGASSSHAASLLRTFPALYQAHEIVRGHSSAPADPTPPGSLATGSSALELVQSIMTMARRGASHVAMQHTPMPLLPPEHYHLSPDYLPRASTTATSLPGQIAPAQEAAQVSKTKSSACSDCAALSYRIEQLEASVMALQTTQRQLLTALDTAIRGSQVVDEKATTEATLDHVVESLRSASGRLIHPEDAAPSPQTMALFQQVAARLTQVESDLDTTVSETQKMEVNILNKVAALESSAQKKAEMPAALAEWTRLQRDETLDLCKTLYQFLGLPVHRVQEAVAQRDIVAVDRTLKDSNIAKSLMFAAPPPHEPSSDAADRKRGGGYGGSPPRSDTVGALPLPARMLGVHLVDEPFAPGVRVREVVPGSPAALAGVRPGEYLVAFNRVPLRSTSDAISALATTMAGAVVRVHRVDRTRSKEDVVEVVAGSRRV